MVREWWPATRSKLCVMFVELWLPLLASWSNRLPSRNSSEVPRAVNLNVYIPDVVTRKTPTHLIAKRGRYLPQ